MPYDCEKIMAIADKYGIPVVEDAAEGMGSRFNGQVLGTFGKYGVLSFNGNKMITTSGGGALICRNADDANNIMWYATQARDAYPRADLVGKLIMPMDGGTGKPPLQAFDMAPEEVFLYLYRTVPEISLECAEIIITFDR